MAGSEAKSGACIVPASKDSVPLEGEALKNRDDVPTFDTRKIYDEGTIVKYQSLDGEYILGKTNTLYNLGGTNTSTFTAVDSESYSKHNSVADEYKSMILGAENSVQKAALGLAKLGSYVLEVMDIGTAVEQHKDGSNIGDWSKMESNYSYTNEYGTGKIHYYINVKTGKVSYYDAKMKISAPKPIRSRLTNTVTDKDGFGIVDLDENLIPIGVRK